MRIDTACTAGALRGRTRQGKRCSSARPITNARSQSNSPPCSRDYASRLLPVLLNLAVFTTNLQCRRAAEPQVAGDETPARARCGAAPPFWGPWQGTWGRPGAARGQHGRGGSTGGPTLLVGSAACDWHRRLALA